MAEPIVEATDAIRDRLDAIRLEEAGCAIAFGGQVQTCWCYRPNGGSTPCPPEWIKERERRNAASPEPEPFHMPDLTPVPWSSPGSK